MLDQPFIRAVYTVRLKFLDMVGAFAIGGSAVR